MTKIFLTGRAGCGKSTVLLKIVELLRKEGLKVGGITTPEVRVSGRRTGFLVKDIYSRKEGWLAKVCTGVHEKPRLGKYTVDLESFERIALPALDFATKDCDIIVIDEIGRIEYFSKKFQKKVEKIISCDKPLLAVLHRNYIKEFEKHGKIIWVTYKNREKLPEEIVKEFSGSARN